MSFTPPGLPQDLPDTSDAPASFGPYLGPGKGMGASGPFGMGPPGTVGDPLGDSNSLQHDCSLGQS